MQEINKTCFQGDVCFRRVKSIPEGFEKQERKAPRLIVAHSETGHHHAIDEMGVVVYEGKDPLVCYLQLVSVESCDVVHHRPFDTHETVRLGGGEGSVFQVIKQREHTPQGWRQVMD